MERPGLASLGTLVDDPPLVGADPNRARTIPCAAVPQSVCIVGGTGALGFGLALRLGRAGVPIVIGSRDAARADQAAGRAKDVVPDGWYSGLQNADAVGEAEIVILSVPFRSQSETMTNIKSALSSGQ